MSKALCFFIMLVISFALSFAETNKSADVIFKLSPIAIPGGAQGIGFDDMVFSKNLHSILVPSGRTGKLNLLDVNTKEITSIGGFSEGKEEQGGRIHEAGTTSADEGNGFIFATDHTKKVVVIIDPVAKTIISSTPLLGGSDYVRYVSTSNEVWITDPHSQQIEVFSFSTITKPTLIHSKVIAVSGGPESLVIDSIRQRAYTNLWTGSTIAIDIKTHAIVAKWPNSCEGSRGIAIDEKRGFLFIGGKEGKAVVLDLNHNGKLLSSLQSGSGVDIISYNSVLSHLYLPGGDSATMAILGVSSTGKLSLLGVKNTVKGSRCVIVDYRDGVWVTDPDRGQLLFFNDLLPRVN